MKYALKSVTGLADVGVPPEVWVGPRTSPRCLEEVWKKFQITILTIPSNINSMKYAEICPMGLGLALEPHPDVQRRSGITMPNNIYFMEYALKPVPVSSCLCWVGLP